MSISFNKLPGSNEIFLDYINDMDKLKEFFGYDYRNEDSFVKCADEKQQYLENKDFSRNDLADILIAQNKGFNSSSKAFENIDLLREENTFAIVTGQQTGLLTGPLYTIYKALNTIQLAEKLSKLYTDKNFVPVFWLEADDHDFLEVNNLTLIDKTNSLVNFKYFEGGEHKEKYLKPVSSIVLDDHIEKLTEDIKAALPQTDFTETLIDLIQRSYKPGIDMRTAFARFMNYLFKDMGMIFFDPADKEIKKLMIPVFRKELTSYPGSCETVIDTTARLERKYEPQVKPKAINLFYTHNGSRYLIEPREEGYFSLRNSRQKFEKEEFLNMLNKNPENFSGNVITRPILQDYVLPTVAYIGGPSEIAYFAQLKDVYKYFDVTMPVIYPRTSVTLLEKKVTSFLDKYELDFTELLNEKQISEKLLKLTEEINIDELFIKYKDEINAVNYAFENELAKADKSLVNTFKNRAEKFVEGMDGVKQKFIDSQLRQNETAVSKLKTIVNFVFPEGVLQERVLNILYFLNKYDIGIIKTLKENISIDDFTHQITEAGVKQPEVTADTELQNS